MARQARESRKVMDSDAMPPGGTEIQRARLVKEDEEPVVITGATASQIEGWEPARRFDTTPVVGFAPIKDVIIQTVSGPTPIKAGFQGYLALDSQGFPYPIDREVFDNSYVLESEHPDHHFAAERELEVAQRSQSESRRETALRSALVHAVLALVERQPNPLDTPET